MLGRFSIRAFQAVLGSILLFQQAQAVGNYDTNCCDNDCGGGFFAKADYLYWQIENDRKLIPFVIEGPFDPLDPVLFLGSPGSTVVLGGKKENTAWRSGGKFAVGYWFDDSRCFGAELSYFILPNKSRSSSVSSDGSATSPFLAVPFFDVTTDLESSSAISFPGSFEGLASLRTRNRMQGIEANALLELPFDCATKIGVLAGFRFWNFEDNLSFNTSSPYILPTPVDIFSTKDKFRTRNNFYGFQIGANFDYLCNGFFFDVEGKIALGAMCQKSVIHGSLSTDDFSLPGVPLTYSGGYFALPSNIGSHTKTKFAWIPEINCNAGYQVTDSLRLQVGYTFFWVSEVARASRQVSRYINPTQSVAIEFDPDAVLVGPAAPKGKLKSKGMWVQGVNAGIAYSF
jgi:hypothetical protein